MRKLKTVRMKLERRGARKDDILNFCDDKLLLIEHNSRNWSAILLISFIYYTEGRNTGKESISICGFQ